MSNKNTLQCGDNLQYLYNGNGNLSVVAINPDMDSDKLGEMWDNIKPLDEWDIETVYIQPGVTRLGDRAFEDLSLLEVSIPDSVEEIGEKTFSGCLNLEETYIPNSVKEIDREAFSNTGLNGIIIPNSVQNINYGAFKDNDNLAEVIVDAKNINESAFLNNPSLTSVKFGPNVNHIGDLAFGDGNIKSAMIPETVKTIGRHPFYGNKDVEVVIDNKQIIAELKNEGVNARKPNLVERAMLEAQNIKIFGNAANLKEEKTVKPVRDEMSL